jgi:hypothetical protein
MFPQTGTSSGVARRMTTEAPWIERLADGIDIALPPYLRIGILFITVRSSVGLEAQLVLG